MAGYIARMGTAWRYSVMMYFADVPVYLHRAPVDFRKSINGLSALVEQDMGVSPFTEALFVFGCRSRDKVKVLYWDKTGFCLWHKRFRLDELLPIKQQSRA